MTQNMTQNFYGAATQIINESTLNETRPDNVSNRLNADEENIHEAATQVVSYPASIIHKFIENSDGSDINGTVETFDNDIHEAPTQVANYPLASTSTLHNDKMEKQQDVNIHEMPTQVVNLPPELQLIQENDSSTQIDEDIHKPDNSTQLSKKSSSEIEINEIFAQVQRKPNISTVEETVIEETVMEESRTEKDVNEDSNDSLDFLTIHEPFESELLCNKEENLINDKSSNISDSEDIGAPRKRPLRKLSSSEEFSQPQNNKPICNSDSDTDIEVKHKNYNKYLSTNKTVDSGSDTEIEDILPGQYNEKSKVLNSDEETDIEDNKVHDALTQSQDIIKPKILTKKRVLDSDSETDVEDNKKNVASEQALDENSSDTEILNDTDCIPATQDAFADIFVYKDSKPSNVNSQNISSEESFKLGLTELMVESVEHKMDGVHEEDKSDNFENKMKGDVPETDKVDNFENKSEDDVLKENKRDTIVNADDTSNTKTGESSNGHLLDNEDDAYMIPTQKICTDVPEAKSNMHDEVGQKLNDADEDNCLYATEKSINDIYIMPTQKLNEEKIGDKDNIVPPTPQKYDSGKDTDEDFYMMPTQNLNENDNKPQFKTPQKKFNFRKKEVKLDTSLSSIFSKNQDDPYSTPTQNLNEEKDENNIYLLPTQKLNEKQVNDLYLQPTQDLHPSINVLEVSRDEDPYMAPTQEINIKEKNDINFTKEPSDAIEKSKEDLYMAETQPVSSNLTRKEANRIVLTKSVTNPYFEETQELGLSKNTENEKKNIIPQNSTNSEHEIQDMKSTEKNDVYLAATQPINSKITGEETNKVPHKKSVANLYLQETEDINFTTNFEASKIEKSEDPYMMPTQQINQDLAEESSSVNNIFRDSTPSGAAVNEISSAKKRQVNSDLHISSPKRMKKIRGAEVKILDQIDAFIKQPSPTINMVADQSETLSQIQKFVTETSMYSKMSKKGTLSKKRGPSCTTNNATITVIEEDRPETLTQIEAFIKTPLNTVMENNATVSKLQEKDDISNRIEEQPDKVFQKPAEKTIRPRKTKSSNQSVTHVSKEECEITDRLEADTNTSSDNSIGPSNSEQNMTKCDFGKSFALLEAKSTKTRKSQRLTNSAEIKVALCKNRRSMATTAVPESTTVIDDFKPATRKSRKKPTNINNNIIATTSDNTEGKRPKRKLEPAKKDTNLEVSESEKPSKVPKTYTSKKGRQKEETDTISELSSPSTSKLKTSFKTDSIKSSESGNFDDNSSNSSGSSLTTPRRGRRNAQNTPLSSEVGIKKKTFPRLF